MVQEPDHPTSRGTSRASVGNPPLKPDLYDSHLRLALALIDEGDWAQLAMRTGIDCSKPATSFLRLFVELEPHARLDRSPTEIHQLLRKSELLIPEFYVNELRDNPALLTLATRLKLSLNSPALTAESNRTLREHLDKMSKTGLYKRLRIAVPHGKCLERSLAAVDLPPGGVYNYHPLSGRNIIIGIIDDGCAFAHQDFLEVTKSRHKLSYRTRVLSLWDQSQPATAADKKAGWKDLSKSGHYGRELSRQAIDKVLRKHSASGARVEEDAVYAELNYAVGSPAELATHGTKVMGIAAGNGSSMMGWRGVAPRADIVFVQLPPDVIHETPELLSDNIVHAATYIFDYAKQRGQAAVLNISYGGYTGAHDGTSAWEKALDDLLVQTDRAIVVSAGNAFEADCHAMANLQPGGGSCQWGWILNPGDTTLNDLEIWYDGQAALDIWLTSPEGAQQFGPYAFCSKTALVQLSDGVTIGSIEHVQHDSSNGDNSALIALQPTAIDAKGGNPPLSVAPAGQWLVRIVNNGAVAADVHGWIRRDDVATRNGGRQQSRFVTDDAHPGFTICDMATGRLTISAGAFNVATDEVCAYSSCGPTRISANQPRRRKPEICAPGEELATHGGVLTSASRQASPRRMNGTSASAPMVAGVVALAFDFRLNHKKQHLTAAEILAALSAQVGGRALAPDRRQAVQAGRKIKQAQVWGDLSGAGKISCVKTLDKL